MSNNKPSKKNGKKLAKEFTPDEVKRMLKNVEIEIYPAALLKKSADMWNEYEASSPAKKKTLVDDLNKKLEQASAIVALENHYLLAETLDTKKYRTFLIEVTDQLIAEYECKTTSEKMLAQTAGWAYCRMIEYGYKLNSITRIDFLSSEKNGYYSVLSKEVDRCARQYLSAINTLKHFKQPALKVSFKANNAFVAQNQQINSKTKDKSEGQNNVGQ